MSTHHTTAFVRSVEDHRLAKAARRRQAADPGELERVVLAASTGNGAAWSALVERFTARLSSVARRHRLSAHDAEDVVQTTWLRLLEHIDGVREPRAVAGWLETTARRESLRMVRSTQRERPTDEVELGDEAVPSTATDGLLAAERRQAVTRTLATLPPRQQRLLALLFAEPSPSYAEIAKALDMPVGSIGPTRERCLSRLRTNDELLAVAGE
jgi:RNA polymerase sigma factor (sigma-70 family)